MPFSTSLSMIASDDCAHAQHAETANAARVSQDRWNRVLGLVGFMIFGFDFKAKLGGLCDRQRSALLRSRDKARLLRHVSVTLPSIAGIRCRSSRHHPCAAVLSPP